MKNIYADESDNQLRKLIKLSLLSEKIKKSLEIAPKINKRSESRRTHEKTDHEEETSICMLSFYKSKAQELEKKHSDLMKRNDILKNYIQQLTSQLKNKESNINHKLITKRIPSEFYQNNSLQDLTKCPNLKCVLNCIKLIKLRIEHENLIIKSKQTDLLN